MNVACMATALPIANATAAGLLRRLRIFLRRLRWADRNTLPTATQNSGNHFQMHDAIRPNKMLVTQAPGSLSVRKIESMVCFSRCLLRGKSAVNKQRLQALNRVGVAGHHHCKPAAQDSTNALPPSKCMPSSLPNAAPQYQPWRLKMGAISVRPYCTLPSP